MLGRDNCMHGRRSDCGWANLSLPSAFFLPIGAALKAAAVFVQQHRKQGCNWKDDKRSCKRKRGRGSEGEETVEEKKFVFNRNPHITPFQAKGGEATHPPQIETGLGKTCSTSYSRKRKYAQGKVRNLDFDTFALLYIVQGLQNSLWQRKDHFNIGFLSSFSFSSSLFLSLFPSSRSEPLGSEFSAGTNLFEKLLESSHPWTDSIFTQLYSKCQKWNQEWLRFVPK